MRTLATVSNALICAILDGAPLSDAEKQRLMEDVGLRAEVVRDITARTSLLTLWRLWERILRLTNDEFVGLQIGKSIQGDRFGLAVHAAQHGTDFRDVLIRFTRYASLINDMIVCQLEETASEARFAMKFYWDVLDLERHAVDITFAGLVRWAREHLASSFTLREVRLKHSWRAAEPEYRECFGAPVVFGAPRNELILDPATLDQRVLASNPELGMILDRHASAELSKIPVMTDLPARISQIIREELLGGRQVDLPRVSETLKMTPRHLQRKLSDSSTSFSTLLDDTRRSLAPALLLEPSANVEQVGFRLGYSEPTAFIRAFKKWYAMTPGEYRRTKAS